MNIHILLDLLFSNAYVALNCCVLVIFSLLLILFLLLLCNFLTYYFDLIAYCNLALSVANSTFKLTCVGDGSLYVCNLSSLNTRQQSEQKFVMELSKCPEKSQFSVRNNYQCYSSSPSIIRIGSSRT